MKIKLPALHTQILIALVTGALLGAFFNVDGNEFVVAHSVKKETVETGVKEWKSALLIKTANDGGKTDSLSFAAGEKPKLINLFKQTKKEGGTVSLEVTAPDGKEASFESVKTIRNPKTPATWIKWLGDIFILIAGAASLGDIRKFARIGTKTLSYYLTTTAFAVTIGLVLANVIRPGEQMNEATKNNLLQTYAGDTQERIATDVEFDGIKMIVEMIPRNPFAALSQGEMLQIVFFAVFFGMVLTFADKDKSKILLDFFDALSDAMIKMIDVIMKFAPIGVFAL
ncbi:MAG: hypothetical protein EDM75_12645, partial [Chlorobiota bacterium]